MCYKHIEINDFIKEVKDWYKFDFSERELRDIFKYYENDDEEWFPLELNLRERWKFFKSYRSAVEYIWDNDVVHPIDDVNTNEECLDYLDNWYFVYFAYTDGILVKID